MFPINNLIVLAYHSINSRVYSQENAALSVHPTDFEQQISYMINSGYCNIGADELLNPLEVKKKRFLITFDDGYADNYEVAYPILKKYSCKALIFLISSTIDQKNNLVNENLHVPYLNREQIQEMNTRGICFGSHTLSHQRLSSLTNRILSNTIIQSKLDLERCLKIEINYFCAPYGDYPVYAHEIASNNYRLSFLTYAYRTQYNRSRNVISRIGVYRQNSINMFKIKVLRDRFRLL